MGDEFIQGQINDLQAGQEKLKVLVDDASTKAQRNHDTLLCLRDDIQHVQRNLINKDQMQDLLEQNRNAQIAKGVKWIAGIIAVAVAAKWAEAMDWFNQISKQ